MMHALRRRYGAARGDITAAQRARIEKSRANTRVFPPGARVYVDGQREAKVIGAFPQGSTSYAFPHYRLGPTHRRALSTDEIETVAMNRVGVVKRGLRVTTDEERRWLTEYDLAHPLGTLEEARMVADRERRGGE